MLITPLIEAGPTVIFHAGAAIAAFLIGLLLAFVAVSSFWINGLRLIGPFSPIHILSILTLVMLPLGVLRARRHRVSAHKKTMTGVFFGALVLAGLLTLVPGRVMHAVLFGGG